MRLVLGAALLALSGCGQSAAFEYPETARDSFASTCPTGDRQCDCAWEQITKTMSYEQYEAALTRFREEGLMEPQLVRAREACLEL
jgi:hypothetical protein